MPQWLIALVALVIVVGFNLVSVRWFGEVEFWVALIKVAALVLFLIVGSIILGGRFSIQGQQTGFGLLADNGGLFPVGVLPLVTVTTGVVFAYAAVELVGTAAGEAKHPEQVMPGAINAVIARIALFYVGSLVLLGLLLPYSDFVGEESPFVTFFSRLGVHGAGTIMNLVVLTAAFSSLNAGLYSTGRILRSMATNGSAPAVGARMSRAGVPYVGILATGTIALIGVGLNAVVPDKAFEIVLNMSALGTITAWSVIVACQLRLWSWSRRGLASRPAFRLPGAPYTGVATLVFLASVIVLMAVSDDDVQRGAVLAMVVVMLPVLTAGWFLARKRAAALAAEWLAVSGQHPVLPERPEPTPESEDGVTAVAVQTNPAAVVTVEPDRI